MMITVLELAGVILLSIAGWLGGTLVYRNQIGVDIRYAHAGKWSEKYINNDQGEIPVASTDELKVNQMKLLHIKGKRIVLCKTEKGYAAFDDHCTHRGGSLAGGAVICGTVQCPWHGSQFDVFTGSVTAGPATENIGIYSVKEIDGKVILMSKF
jgi:nitrite reductase/ring-hydroxylating ferredoxin subunit